MGALFGGGNDTPQEDPEAKRKREAEEARQDAEKEKLDEELAYEIQSKRSRLTGNKSLLQNGEAGFTKLGAS